MTFWELQALWSSNSITATTWWVMTFMLGTIVCYGGIIAPLTVWCNTDGTCGVPQACPSPPA